MNEQRNYRRKRRRGEDEQLKIMLTLVLLAVVAVLAVVVVVMDSRSPKQPEPVPPQTAQTEEAPHDEAAPTSEQSDGIEVKPMDAEKEEMDIRDTSSIKINYPEVGIPQMDEAVQQYIDGIKLGFESEIKKQTPPEGVTFDLIINSDRTDYKNLIFVHIYSYLYTGGANYERLDESFAFNTEEGKFIGINDLLTSEDQLSDLSALAKKYVIAEYTERGTEYNEEMIDIGTAPDAENYRYFSLKPDGLQITFPPYYVGSRGDGEFIILIPYEELKGILKDNYLEGVPQSSAEAIPAEKRDLSKYKDKKLVAITFDDGPNNPTTIPLVDALEQYDAHVTFFVLGSRVGTHADALRYAYENGHQIGSHTYNHLDLTKVDQSTLESEIAKTDEAIEQVIGVKPTVIRPPYGAKNDAVRQAVGKAIILWNVDTLDWKTKDPDAICEEILNNTSDGSIVLLHDIYQTSVDGVLKAMKTLQDQGYAFVTVDELAELKGVELQNGEVYFNIK